MNTQNTKPDDSLQHQASFAKSMTVRGVVAMFGGMLILGMGLAAGRGRPSAMDLMLMIGGGGAMAIGFIMLIRYASRAERLRTDILARAIESMGVQVIKATSGNRAAGWAPFSHLKHLNTGERGLVWYASGEIDGKYISIAEHRYVVSTGKSSHVVWHTLASCDVHERWPSVTLRPESFIDKLADRLGMRDVKVESERFNSIWRVKSENENFAVLLLSTEVQGWLETEGGADSWHIGDGHIVRSRRKRLEPDACEAFVHGLIAMRTRIPPELDAWSV